MYLLNSKSRLGNITLSFFYCLCYYYIYENFSFKYFEYMGVQFESQSYSFFLLFIFLGSFPLIYYKGLNNFASGLTLFYYLLAYIPVLHAILYGAQISIEIRIFYSLSLFILTCLFFVTDKLILFKKQFFYSGAKLSVQQLFIICSILVGLNVLLNIGNIRFVNFISQRELMYELRAEKEAFSIPILNYLIPFLTNCILPCLLVYYLEIKNKKKTIIIFIYYILVFMTAFQKSTILFPFLIYFIFKIIKKNPNIIRYYFHSFIIITIILISVSLTLLSPINEMAFLIGAVVIYRSINVAGHLFTMYYHFFESHPHTNYSHINIVNSIFHNYPYDNILGRVVSEGAMNANANFIITDGIAACGLIGIFIVSVFFIIFKGTINSIGTKYKLFPTFIILIPGILNYLNVSLFTSIITGGFLFSYIVLRNTNFKALYNGN